MKRDSLLYALPWTNEGTVAAGVWGKRNEKVTGRGGKSSNVNTEHVAMCRKHPAQPAFLQRP